MGAGEGPGGTGVTYRVLFLSSAEREFVRLPKSEREKISIKIAALSENPRRQGSIKLSGKDGIWRVRVGNYRILYRIEDAALIVAITKVAHRRESYRGL